MPKALPAAVSKHCSRANLASMSRRINSAWEETTNAGLKAQLIARVTELSASMNTLRDHRFTERFDFFETKKEEFHCAICLDVLEKPLSSKCQHSCCSDCWKSAFELGEKHPACPICQETLADPNDLQRAPLVLIQLLEGYLVKCRACGTRLPYHLCNSHPCPPRKRQRANSPVPAAAVVLDPQTRTLERMLNEVRTGRVSPDVARLGNLIVNTICKNSEDGITARLPGSGKPTVVMKIPQAQTSDFIRERKFPSGFFGEQGGESIHYELNQLNREFSSIHPASRRLRKIIEEHSIRVAPLNRSEYPEKKNRKRRAHTATT
ncbi:uncharacterized protein LOC116613987 [Nematostella vectensis]|uniref:uncharacterized protein LOC116613987 n=1 Tax=Nematostella vectensis TaxID=45351 RepID=UPI00207743EF|nr:uncharacterized protein LOC116613987 [Nematostella vectensis]